MIRISKFFVFVIVIGIFTMIAMQFQSASALTEAQRFYTPGSFVEAIGGTYRYADVYNSAALVGADTPTTTTFSFTADYILICCDDSANPLHVQFFTSDSDSTFIQPSSVYHVEPGEALPFFGRGVNQVKIALTEAGDGGKCRIFYYKS